jgi:hypothetical protein
MDKADRDEGESKRYRCCEYTIGNGIRLQANVLKLTQEKTAAEWPQDIDPDLILNCFRQRVLFKFETDHTNARGSLKPGSITW